MQPDDKSNPNPAQPNPVNESVETPVISSQAASFLPHEISAPPVVTAIGSVAAQPEVDKTAIPEESQTVASNGAEIPIPPPATAIPDASQQPVPQPSNKVVALPVPTSLLPAFLIGSLILVLFLAVVLYAFVL